MNNFGLSKCGEIRTCLTKECQEKRKSCEAGRCGVETQSEVRLGGRHESHWTSISAKGNLHCPLYSEKEGLSGVETYLIGTGLKTKVFGVYCAQLESPNISISAFTQKDWNPPTLFFNITSSGPYPWSILTDQSSFIVLCHCYADTDDIKKVRDLTRQTCFGTFIRRTHKTSNSCNHTCHWCLYQKHHFMQRQEKDPLGQVCLHFASSEWHEKRQLVIRSPPRHSFHGCDSSGVCDRCHPPPPRRRRTSAAARPPRRGPPALPGAAASSLGRERQPRGSPHGSRRERTRGGKLASCASYASLNLIVT